MLKSKTVHIPESQNNPRHYLRHDKLTAGGRMSGPVFGKALTIGLGCAIIVGLVACSGTVRVKNTNPLTGTTEYEYDTAPKAPRVPLPAPGTLPVERRTINGRQYDVYSTDCPTWAREVTTGMMVYIECTVIPQGGGNGGGGNGGVVYDVSSDQVTVANAGHQAAIGSPSLYGSDSFGGQIADQLAKGFGADSDPLPSDTSVAELLGQVGLLNGWTPGIGSSVQANTGWHFNSAIDQRADVTIFTRSDAGDFILPPSLYEGLANFELVLRDDPDDGLPGIVMSRVAGPMEAVLAYLLDSGISTVTEFDKVMGVYQTLYTDPATREIYWNGAPTGLFADPTPSEL